MKKAAITILIFGLVLTTRVFPNIYGDTIEYVIQGKITYKSGSVVKMQKISGDEMPAAGTKGELSKKFETELFGGKMSGWIAIGDMKVNSVAKDIVTFSLLKELSMVTENGVKKNHFEIGKEVKFVWKVAISADEKEFRMGQEAVDTNMFVAFAHYKRAAAINPGNDKALNMLGIIMNEQEMQDSALVYFKKAFSASPKNSQYAKNISITSFKSGLAKDGYDYAFKAVDCDSTDAEAWYLRSVMRFAIAKDSLKETDKKNILADVGKAIQLTPDDPFYYGERAYFRKTFGDNKGACEDAGKAKELGADNADDLVKEYCQ
jgi:hypothetical protein